VNSSTGDFEIWLKGALGVERLSLSLCGSSVKGTWTEGSPAADPDKYVEKALETAITLHRGPALGNLEEGSSTGDFKMWAERGLWERGIPLYGSSFGEPGGGALFWGPLKVMKGRLWGWVSLLVGAQLGNLE
jgi:hypothetical protein